MEPMYYIGLDVYKRKISYCVNDGSGSIPADLTLASGFSLCFHCNGGSRLVLRRPIETTRVIGNLTHYLSPFFLNFLSRRLSRHSRYSMRSATSGLTRVARYAGTQQANNATPTSSTATPPYVSGSVGLTP